MPMSMSSVPSSTGAWPAAPPPTPDLLPLAPPLPPPAAPAWPPELPPAWSRVWCFGWEACEEPSPSPATGSPADPNPLMRSQTPGPISPSQCLSPTMIDLAEEERGAADREETDTPSTMRGMPSPSRAETLYSPTMTGSTIESAAGSSPSSVASPFARPTVRYVWKAFGWQESPNRQLWSCWSDGITFTSNPQLFEEDPIVRRSLTLQKIFEVFKKGVAPSNDAIVRYEFPRIVDAVFTAVYKNEKWDRTNIFQLIEEAQRWCAPELHVYCDYKLAGLLHETRLVPDSLFVDVTTQFLSKHPPSHWPVTREIAPLLNRRISEPEGFTFDALHIAVSEANQRFWLTRNGQVPHQLETTRSAASEAAQQQLETTRSAASEAAQHQLEATSSAASEAAQQQLETTRSAASEAAQQPNSLCVIIPEPDKDEGLVEDLQSYRTI